MVNFVFTFESGCGTLLSLSADAPTTRFQWCEEISFMSVVNVQGSNASLNDHDSKKLGGSSQQSCTLSSIIQTVGNCNMLEIT